MGQVSSGYRPPPPEPLAQSPDRVRHARRQPRHDHQRLSFAHQRPALARHLARVSAAGVHDDSRLPDQRSAAGRPHHPTLVYNGSGRADEHVSLPEVKHAQPPIPAMVGSVSSLVVYRCSDVPLTCLFSTSGANRKPRSVLFSPQTSTTITTRCGGRTGAWPAPRQTDTAA
jgi:hypothetical protein